MTVDAAGTLQIGNGGTRGSITGDVTNNGMLAFDRSDALNFAGAISGSGGVSQIGTGTTTLGGANTYSGGTTLAAGTLSVANDGNLGSASGGISFSGGRLNTTGSFTANRAVTINAAGGTVDTDTATTLTLGGALTGSGGLTKAGSGTLVLAGTDSHGGGTTISAGTLQVGNATTAGALAGNVTNNAALVFANTAAPIAGAVSGSGTVTKTGSGTTVLTGNNDYTGGTTISAGTLQLGDGGSSGSIAGDVTNNGTLAFKRGDAVTFAGAISGGGGVQQIGTGTTVLTNTSSYSGGTVIAAGTLQLGNGGNSGSITGDVTTNGTLAFDRGDAVTFAGAISGSGGVRQIGAGTTTLTATNSYTGGTVIAAGTLQLGNGGFTGGVVGAIVDDAALVINRSNALTLAGPISGSGSVTQRGSGSTTFTADNSYSGGTTIVAGALRLGDGGSTGSVVGNIRNDSMLVLNRSNTLQLAGVISGSGELLQMGGGSSVLSGANNYRGATTVAAGTLKAGAAGALSAASAHTVAAGATLDTGGFDQGVASLRNAGTVSLLGAGAGSTLTVNGAYVGSGGVLSLGTVLAGSGSVSDRLVLNGAGAGASGKTTVRITNLGGLGGLTTGNGIEVVSAVGGATTTAQTTRDAFALANGHVDAGAFEYRLYAADASGAGQNWYLRSSTTVSPTPSVVVLMPSAVPMVVEETSPGKTESPVISVPTYRAEVPLFAALPAQLRQADLAMLGNLHRRVGDELAPAAGAAAGDPSGGRQAWARAIYSDLDIRQQGPAAADSQGHVSGVQAGTDLLANGGWRAGVYVGTLDGSANVAGNARGLVASVGSNDLKSRFVGGYATWMNGDGLYADAVLQGGSHSYTVQPYGNLNIDGKSSSLAASIEAGKAFALGEGWTIEPQAQLIHQSQRFDHVLIGGALVTQDANDGWIGRLGVRVKGDVMTAAGRLQPYGRLNVYRASSGTDVASFIGPAASTPIASAAGYTSTELAAGMTLALSASTTLYGEIGQIYSAGGDAKVQSTLQGSIGMRLRW